MSENGGAAQVIAILRIRQRDSVGTGCTCSFGEHSVRQMRSSGSVCKTAQNGYSP